LPAGVSPTDRDAVTTNEAVQRVCNVATFQATTSQKASGWALSVLPPTGSDRTFRCLAGRGADALTGPVLAR
jgi:hypothetical protein